MLGFGYWCCSILKAANAQAASIKFTCKKMFTLILHSAHPHATASLYSFYFWTSFCRSSLPTRIGTQLSIINSWDPSQPFMSASILRVGTAGFPWEPSFMVVQVHLDYKTYEIDGVFTVLSSGRMRWYRKSFKTDWAANLKKPSLKIRDEWAKIGLMGYVKLAFLSFRRIRFNFYARVLEK